MPKSETKYKAVDLGIEWTQAAMNRLTVGQLEHLVFKHINPKMKYSFLDDQQCDEGLAVAFMRIEPVAWRDWSEWNRRLWRDFMAGPRPPRFVTHLILERLVTDEVIPPGDWLIG
jgi:hypothetical protein